MGRTELTITTLDSGLRVVHRRCPGATEYCGLTVNAGSRDELTPQCFGLAHFVEHTIFKGTPRRSDSYILNRMEAVGGELNAFTTKEETTVYAAMPAGAHTRACTLIGELVTESVFPARKLKLEREVILDEIESYLDTPSEAVYDSFDEMVYAGNSLAHNILGTRHSVLGITSDACCSYLRQAFTANNSVYFYLGPESASKVIGCVQKHFANLPLHSELAARTAPCICPPRQKVNDSGSHQCHVVMGAPIGGLHSPDRHVIALATNILGGPGMNALLNVELRERRGLVYTVEASTALMSDCGMMTIYFGCDHDDLNKCKELVSKSLNKFADTPVSERRLAAYKRQYLGQLTLGLDNKEQRALSSARALLHGLEQPSLERTAQILNSITATDLQAAAQILAAAPQRTLTLA